RGHRQFLPRDAQPERRGRRDLRTRRPDAQAARRSRLMRSLPFVPGDSARMMTQANASGADVVIYDLEDAVLPQDKKAVRPRRRPRSDQAVSMLKRHHVFFFFLNSNSSIRFPDGSSRSLARPAPASLISPLNLAPPVLNRPMRPSMSFVTIMN